MKNFSIRRLADIIASESGIPEDGFFTGICTDSRSVKSGDCFFAIAGENFDGHDYVKNALDSGAACAVVERNITCQNLDGKAVLKVKSTLNALGKLAAQYRRENDFKVIAVTGSAGKTTTRKIIAHVLGSFFPLHQSPKNFNNNIGLPLTLLGAEEHHKIIVTELGSNHPGEIAYLTAIAQPDIAVVTNVYPAHLEGFGDLKTIVNEKLSISQGLRPGGTFLINGRFRELVETCKAKKIAFTAFVAEADLPKLSIGKAPGDSGSYLTIDGTEVYVPLCGRGNIENTLAAWAVCRLLGLNIRDFASAIRTLPNVSMRAEVLKIGSMTIFNDCYNANPGSMNNALDMLACCDCRKDQRRVFICGDMGELGLQASYFHEQLGQSVAQTPINLLVTVGRLSKVAADAAKKSADNGLQIKSFDDTISLCNMLKDLIKDSDIILVKGSRAAGLEIVVEKLKELFENKIPAAAKSNV